jgi:protein-S-isoprenylcysteine O-methyltransferase Ste14
VDQVGRVGQETSDRPEPRRDTTTVQTVIGHLLSGRSHVGSWHAALTVASGEPWPQASGPLVRVTEPRLRPLGLRFEPVRLRHFVALILPVGATVVVPWLVVSRTRLEVGGGLPTRVDVLAVVIGSALILAGLALVAWTASLFASEGRGTLAPWDPTHRLVVRGPYRHVRNPMISGVVAIILGEAALVGSPRLLAWFGAFAAANATYIPLVEEHGLMRRFGDEYLRYRQNVPRWIPRFSAWKG